MRSPHQKKKGKGQQPAGKPKRQAEAKLQPPQQQTQAATEAENVSKTVISMLQEFIQSSKQFPAPTHRAVLQWSFQSHMADFSNHKFRAKVSFTLDGVAHHVMGSWQTSKKLAQRDAAERSLGFFVSSWGSYLVEPGDSSDKFQPELDRDNVTIIEEFCQNFPPCDGNSPRWSVESDGEGWCASAEMSIFGVLHTFAGAQKLTAKDAKADAAKRILWYLSCQGFEDAFEPDPHSSAMVANEIPAPPATWGAVEGDEDSARGKALLMQAQNRLQQHFSKQLKPGQSVTEWSFETDAEDAARPALWRAKAHVPAACKTFVSAWAQGQEEAQFETCQRIIAFLDSGCVSSMASTACSLASGEESESDSRAEAYETTSATSEGTSQRHFSWADESCEDGEVEAELN